MVNSKSKGSRGERELSKVLNELLGTSCRRGQQFSGIEGDDVVGLDGIHIECKRVEKLNLGNAWEQSKKDAKENEVPVVMHRKNRQEWLVTMSLVDWCGMYKEKENAV